MAESAQGGSSGYETRQLAPSNTFFQPAPVTPVQSNLSAGSAGAQVVGGQSTAGVTRPQLPSAQGWGSIGDVVEKIMAPKTKAAQQQKFWQGVVAARGGQAINEIVKEQSPLASIFGPSSYVQGAQFYTSQDKLANYNEYMLRNADELANVPPDQLGDRLNRDMQEFQTGDPGTDALIQNSWIEQTGPALNVIMKTRFAQQQQMAKNAFMQNAASNAGILQTLAEKRKAGTATSDDYLTQMQITAQAHTIPAGMTAETYRAFLPQVAKEYADKGNFHATTMLKQSGALAHMNVADRTKLDEYIDRKEKDAASKYRYGNAVGLAKLVGGLRAGAVTASEYNDQIKAMDKDFRETTGAIDTPLIPWAEQESSMVTGVTNWYEGQAKLAAHNRTLADKAATEQEKAAALARSAQQVSTLIASGSAGEAASLYGIPAQEVDASFVQAASTMAPEQVDQLLTSNWAGTKYVNGIIKNRLAQGLRATVSADYSPAVDKAHQDWKRLVSAPDGAATAGAYYDTEDRIRMERYDGLLNLGQPPAVAFRVAFQDPLTQAVDQTKKFGDDKEIRGVIKDRFTTWYGQTADMRTELDEFSLNLVGGLVKNNIQLALANTGLSVQQATRAEVNNLLANGLENFGGMAWTKRANQQPLASYITSGKHAAGNYNAVPPGTLDKLFGSYVKEGMKSAGNKDVEAYQVVRMADAQGKAYFHVIGHNKDGTLAKPYSFNSEDLSKAYEKRLFEQVKESKPTVPDTSRNAGRPFGISQQYFPPAEYQYLGSKPK